MIDVISVRFGWQLSRRHRFALVAFSMVSAIQPFGALADQCQDAQQAFYQSGISALNAGVQHLFKGGDTVEDRQKHRCDLETDAVASYQIQLKASRTVALTCGDRVTIKPCDIACQEKRLSEQENKADYACSPAALQEARKAARQEEAKRKDDNEAENACAFLIGETMGVPDEPEVHAKNLRLCNANIEACQTGLEVLKGEKKSVAGLTCAGR